MSHRCELTSSKSSVQRLPYAATVLVRMASAMSLVQNMLPTQMTTCTSSMKIKVMYTIHHSRGWVRTRYGKAATHEKPCAAVGG